MAATWGDVVSLIVISALFFGCIAAFVYVTESAKKTAACVELGSAETLELTNNNLMCTSCLSPVTADPSLTPTSPQLHTAANRTVCYAQRVSCSHPQELIFV